MSDTGVPGGMTTEITVAMRAQVSPGCMRRIEAGESAFVLFNVDGEFHAARDVCPHKGAQLSAGDLEDGVVICPLHAWEFDVRTGECISMPEWPSLTLCDVRVDGDIVRLVMGDLARRELP